jgi:hypothetical protein
VVSSPDWEVVVLMDMVVVAFGLFRRKVVRCNFPGQKNGLVNLVRALRRRISGSPVNIISFAL